MSKQDAFEMRVGADSSSSSEDGSQDAVDMRRLGKKQELNVRVPHSEANNRFTPTHRNTADLPLHLHPRSDLHHHVHVDGHSLVRRRERPPIWRLSDIDTGKVPAFSP
jgi:hypothetical protein